METLGKFVKVFFDWMQANPYLGVLIILTSLIANFISIFDKSTQRRKSEEDKKRFEDLKNRLTQYEYLFGEIEVDKQFKTSLEKKREQLLEVSSDVEEQQKIIQEIEKEKKNLIQQKEEELHGLEDRLKQVVATAKNEALRQSIQRRLNSVQEELLEIQDLKEQYVVSDAQLNLPENIRKNLTDALREFVPENKARFPQSFIFQTVVLLTLVLLLPWPLDNIVLLVSFLTLIELIFQAVKLFNNTSLKRIVIKNYRLLSFATLYTLWKGVLDWVINTFQLDRFLFYASDFLNRLALSYLPHTVFTSNLPSGDSGVIFTAQDGAYTSPTIVGNQFFSYALSASAILVTLFTYILPFLITLVHYMRFSKPIKKLVGQIEIEEPNEINIPTGL